MCRCVFNSSISKVLAEDSFLFALFPSPEAASEVKITKTPQTGKTFNSIQERKSFISI